MTREDLYQYVPINFDLLEKENITKLNDCIKQPDILYCTCGSEKTICEVFTNNVVFLYFETLKTENVILLNIPANLKLFGCNFKINSFVAYICKAIETLRKLFITKKSLGKVRCLNGKYH